MHSFQYTSKTFSHDNLSQDNYELTYSITLQLNTPLNDIIAIVSPIKQLQPPTGASCYPENNIPMQKATMQKGQIPMHSLPKNFLQ